MKPLNKSKLKSLISKGETDVLEFKKSFGQEVIVSLSAFANTKGGSVLIGVDDDGKIIGVNIAEETIQNWINEIKQKTDPCIVSDADVIVVNKKSVVVFSVKEFPVKPVSVQGRYYKRVSNSNHKLTLNEIYDLYIKAFNLSWDYHTDAQLSLNNISKAKVQKYMSFKGNVIRFLKKHELLREGKLTRAAYLLFVRDISALTSIQAGRFKSQTKIIDNATIQTDLFSEVDLVINFIKKHLMTEYIITGKAKREERYDYPLEAIREIVLNMIVHRDYQDSGDSIIKMFDDRIEFFNPGRLTEGLTVAELLSDNYSPKARNKLINLMFKEAGLVEKYGSGIKRIMDNCNNHGKCKVHFENMQHGFRVILSKEVNVFVNDTVNEPVNDTVNEPVNRLNKITALIVKKPRITLLQMAESCNVSVVTIKRDLEKLKKQGVIIRVGSDKKGHWELVKYSGGKNV